MLSSGGLSSKTMPIQNDYLQLVEKAAEKIEKYRQRGFVKKIYYVSKEAVCSMLQNQPCKIE